MSIPPLASLAEFESRSSTALERGRDTMRAAALLDDASALVRVETGRDWLEEVEGEWVWVEYDDVPSTARAQSTIRAVVCSSALRAYENPDGVESETLGEWSATRSKLTSSNGCWLMDAEKRALHTILGQSGLVSVPVERPEVVAVTDDTVGDLVFPEWVGAGGYDPGDPTPWPPAAEAEM